MADHPTYQGYPEWDDRIQDAYYEKRSADLAEEEQRKKDAELIEVQQRREAYDSWLRESPEWRSLREKVITRANGICEACLAAKAQHVHHETYSFGALPPAYWLKAVCRRCHSRIHCPDDEWGSR